MSIASDIQGTADFLAGCFRHKKNIHWGTAGLLAEKLLALADRVKHLENVPLRLDSPDVVAISFRKWERHDAE